MKQIKAFIDPTRLDELRVNLEARGVEVLTLHHGHSVGRKPDRLETYRGATYVIAQISELELTIVVPDTQLPVVLATIEQHGGEGDILISPVEGIVRISKGNGKAKPDGTTTGTPERIPVVVSGRGNEEATGVVTAAVATQGAL